MTDAQSTPTAAAEVILLPSDRFFVRTVPLAADADRDAQVALALENLAPFPVEQLYYGYLLAPARDSALVFASYRKRFTAEETVDWSTAAVVLPAFVALLGDPPATPTIRVWSEAGGITAVAWDGKGQLPVAVLARATEQLADGAQRAALAEEIRVRTGLASAAVREFSGAATTKVDRGRETLALAVTGSAGGVAHSLGRGQIDRADVRDKLFLTGQRTALKRDRLLWRAFAACLAGLAAMLVLEAGFVVGGGWSRGIKDTVQAQSAAVKRIETAQSLSVRIEEMTQRRLMPLEMLALINQNRPASIQFIRTTSTGLYSLEIEAQTANAADVGQYEAVLRASQDIAGIETRDLRSRDGITSFVLTVKVKPTALHPEVGS